MDSGGLRTQAGMIWNRARSHDAEQACIGSCRWFILPLARAYRPLLECPVACLRRRPRFAKGAHHTVITPNYLR